VRTGDGNMVQLSNLVDTTETVAAKELNHMNRLRAATISAGQAPGYSQGAAIEFMEKTLREVARDASYDLSGPSREFREASSQFGLILVLALVFIYLVLAAQFESWVDPFIILLSVPLAAFGAFLCLWLLKSGAEMPMPWGQHQPLWHATASWNVYTKIGIVTLIGLIAKHGILIVEFANQLQEQGMDRLEAAMTAAKRRLRPILMTTGAMVLGAFPLAFASGAGAEARHQIGWVIVGGMSFGTLLTLFVVPAVYSLIARRHEHAPADEGEPAPA
jgi:multidrug efflux pump